MDAMDKQIQFARQETKHMEEAKNRAVPELKGDVETLRNDKTWWIETWTVLRAEPTRGLERPGVIEHLRQQIRSLGR
ncbi:hypothetical protein R1flu_028444 [Riccia fluitans]|uniref:Uncharacterized protein n=1 Tax=Riccia fluitans TaxID=41844 RepID=A0ABD1XPJ5_9MARC